MAPGQPEQAVGGQQSQAASGERSAKDAPDAPLSLADLKQAKSARKLEKALQQGRPLSVELLAKRARQVKGQIITAKELASQQLVEMDRERISSIPREVCSVMGSVTRLYLQHNSFVDMTCFGQMHQMRYLNLAHNSITEVSGIRDLKLLMVLDLSHNLISELDVEELPKSLQFIQLQDNPVASNQPALFAQLVAGLPNLRQIDGRDVPINRKYSDASLPNASTSTSDGFTNELIEAALAELEQEAEAANAGPTLPPLVPSGKAAIRVSSSSSLDALAFSRTSSKGVEEGPSPIRVTPAASRQASAELGGQSPSEVREVLARVREALPTVREAGDVGFESKANNRVSLGAGPRRSYSTEGHDAGYAAGFRRMRSDEIAGGKFRAASLPFLNENVHRTASCSGHGSLSAGHGFPLTSPPPDASTHPGEFRAVLSAAISTLVGSRGPPLGVARAPEVLNVWAETQQHRQQVLDSLFAKRNPDAQDQTQSSNSTAPSTAPGKQKVSLKRADSTISKHRRSVGSTINDELLQGLHLRDPPRAEGLSEALQGPPIQPPGEQLASLSQEISERAVAEHARMSLRRGIYKMLDAAQKRRQEEPATESALVAELNKLKRMKSLQALLSVREGHISPQPQVLATIISSHSRLGSITDRLTTVLHTPGPTGFGQKSNSGSTLPNAWPSSHADTSPRQYPRSPKAEAAGPSAESKSSTEGPLAHRLASPFETSGPRLQSNQDARRQFLVKSSSARSSSSSSSSGTESHDTSRAASRHLLTAPASYNRPQTIPEGSKPLPMQRKPSVRHRRGLPDPSSPGSDVDLDPNPPLDRQSARPIFGGIAKLVRGPSGQLEPPPSPVPTTARTLTQRLPSGKLPQWQASSGAKAPSSKATPLAGSGAITNLNKGSGSSSDKDSSDQEKRRPPRAAQVSQKTINLQRAQSNFPQTEAAVEKESQRKSALFSAANKEAKFQAELWTRFSGGAGSAARELHTAPSGMTAASPFSSAAQDADKPPQQFTSPFSAFSATTLPTASPFSQASTGPPEDERVGLGADVRGKSWHQGDVSASPFARSHLPFISRPPASPSDPKLGIGQSAPPLPATETESRISEANALDRNAPGANSAPADVALWQALRDSLAKQSEQAPASGISLQEPIRLMPSSSSTTSPFESAAVQWKDLAPEQSDWQEQSLGLQDSSPKVIGGQPVNPLHASWQSDRLIGNSVKNSLPEPKQGKQTARVSFAAGVRGGSDSSSSEPADAVPKQQKAVPARTSAAFLEPQLDGREQSSR